MKFRSIATIVLAVLALAADPLRAQQAEPPGAFERIVSGTKAFARNPFGLFGADRGGNARPAGSRLRQPRPVPNSGSQRISSFLPEAIAGDRDTRQDAAVQQASWTEAPERRPRTVSEYMAEEKP